MDFVTASVVCQHTMMYLTESTVYWRLRSLSKSFKYQIDQSLPRWRAKRLFIRREVSSGHYCNIMPNQQRNGICRAPAFDNNYFELFYLNGELLHALRIDEDGSCHRFRNFFDVYPRVIIYGPNQIEIRVDTEIELWENYHPHTAQFKIEMWYKRNYYIVLRSNVSLIYSIHHDKELMRVFREISQLQTFADIQIAVNDMVMQFALDRDAPHKIVNHGLSETQ